MAEDRRDACSTIPTMLWLLLGMLSVNPARLRAYRSLERHYSARERCGISMELLGTLGASRMPAEVPDIPTSAS